MPVVITDLEIKDDAKGKMNKAEEVMMKHSAKKLSNHEAKILVKKIDLMGLWKKDKDFVTGKEKTSIWSHSIKSYSYTIPSYSNKLQL